MPPFHVTLHAAPADDSDLLERLPPIEVDERRIAPMGLRSDQLQRPFTVSFEEAAERLGRLERLYFEPDGSFVWVGAASGDRSAWQLDGVLYDRAGRLQYVELKGTCPPDAFAELLRALDVSRRPIIVQLVRQALYVDAREWMGE